MKHLKRLFIGLGSLSVIGALLFGVIAVWATYPITFVLSIVIPLAYGLGEALIEANKRLQ